VLGVAIFGTLTGYLANLFLSPTKGEQAAADAAATSHPEDDTTLDRRLKRLAQAGALRDSGVLTAAEFEATKAAILTT
jgi:hypothetical protein